MEKINLTECFKVLENVKKMFLAFNSNIDYILYLNKRIEKIAESFRPKPFLPQKILSPKDLFSGIMYSIKFNEGVEVGMEGEIENWLLKNIKPRKKRIGGQTGIMSNNLALFGIKPIVFTPLLSKEQRNLFNKRVSFVKESFLKTNATKINWIFEYNKRYNFLGIKAKGTNRFIASSRREDFRIREINLNFDFDAAILSGFHVIKRRYKDKTTYKEQFRIAENLVKK